MDKKELKEIGIRLWAWLEDNPGKMKVEYPLYDKEIKKLRCACPICEVYILQGKNGCEGCPLLAVSKRDRGKICCELYMKWLTASCYDRLDEARESAGIILNVMKSWDIGEE